MTKNCFGPFPYWLDWKVKKIGYVGKSELTLSNGPCPIVQCESCCHLFVDKPTRLTISLFLDLFLMVYLSNSRNLQILRRQNAVSTFLLRGFHNFLNLPISKTRAGWSGDLSKQQLLCIITIFVSYTLPLSHLRLDASFCIIFSLKV